MQLDRVRVRVKEPDFRDYVRELFQGKRLDGDAVLGIAIKIVASSVESLSLEQFEIFMRHGLYPSNYVEKCERCAEDIPWCEMYSALEDPYCSYCRHVIEKDN
ncbi:hypothetical protein ACN6MY_21450 [Peribacillus sp. B-H-3]|uniref:hypothetical protein n=1 Tax=Peribacillus sp. B-H-3 TaxID=3400420 RepID=UPI003B021CCF